ERHVLEVDAVRALEERHGRPPRLLGADGDVEPAEQVRHEQARLVEAAQRREQLLGPGLRQTEHGQVERQVAQRDRAVPAERRRSSAEYVARVSAGWPMVATFITRFSGRVLASRSAFCIFS